MGADASEAGISAWPAAIAAAILRRGSMVHAPSMLLTFAALLAGVTALILGPDRSGLWLATCGAVFALGIVEFWLAARVALDAELFATIAAMGGGLDGFDSAMRDLGLMRVEKVARALPARISAALRLLKLQAAVLGLQIGALAAGTICVWASR